MKTEAYVSILQRLATILSVAILTLSLTATVTGILLAFYYEPAAGAAYNSLQAINTEVNNGWLIQRLHDLAGNGLIVVSLIQIVVMFLGRKFQRSWLTAWISGIFLTLSAIALGWTAIILDWTELGYWRLNIELGIIDAIPVVGAQLRNILTGGGAITTATVEHLYTIHSYILSIGAIALSIIHLSALLLQEKQQKQMQLELAENELAATSIEKEDENRLTVAGSNLK